MAMEPETRFSLRDRTAVVTGALGRLGPVWVETLLEAGARVLALDLPRTPLPPRWALLEQEYGDALLLLRADIMDRPQLEAAREEALGKLGEPHVLVNNAGVDQPPAQIPKTYRIEEMPLEISRAILEVNLLGLFQVTQVFGSRMCALKRGSIINLGSLYASVSPDARMYDHLDCTPPFLKPPAYGASKAAVIGLTRYLAAHWGPAGVRVNALSPGGVLGSQDEEFKRKFSGRVPLGRLATPDDLKGPILFLASDASSYVTGIELQVDGGYTVW